MTAIETYEVEEVANNVDDSAETRELIESLNLQGQKKLATGNGTIFPYRKMTLEEIQVYERILPKKTNATEYASGSIPLRVLQVMAHANSLDFFTSFQIWHPEDVRKDPLLLGLKQTGQYEWNHDRYILARWGEVLESLDVLKAKAIVIAKEQIRAAAAESKAKCEMALASLDTWGAEKVFGGWNPL